MKARGKMVVPLGGGLDELKRVEGGREGGREGGGDGVGSRTEI